MLVTEEAKIEGESVPIFRLEQPKSNNAVPFLFNSPHSGAHYPDHFLRISKLKALVLRKTEDAFVHEIFSEMPSCGAVFLQSLFPRSYIDLNREPYELDRSMLIGKIPSYANTRSVRVKNGLGTVARVVSEYEAIYKTRLPVEVVLNRIERLYKPYHAVLSQQLDKIYKAWGQSILVDCHSMPSFAPVGRIHKQDDIVIGDRYGASCDKNITMSIKESLVKRGYNVALNKPYAGGFITQNYGLPEKGQHAVQIEINRAIYMNENTLEKSNDFSVVKQDITDSMKEVTQSVTEGVLMNKVAAE